MDFLTLLASTDSNVRRIVRVLLLAIAFVASVTGAQAAGVTLSSQEQQIANYLAGSGQNRPFVKMDPILTQVARNRANDMAVRHYYAHTNPDGHGPNFMVAQAGYKLPASYTADAKSNYIESVDAGHASASDTWSTWMGSPDHKKHLLAELDFYKEQTSFGVGFVNNPSSDYQYYWVVITCPPQPIPALTVVSPANGVQVQASAVTVSGATGAGFGVASVAFRVENAAGIGAFQTATGLTAWSGAATGLQPGANVVRIRSLGATGNLLAEELRTVNFLQASNLTVSLSDATAGIVTIGFLGTTPRFVGYAYTVACAPKPGMIFKGWSGSVSSSSATLRFVMTPDMTLTANFAPNPYTVAKGAYLGLVSGDSDGQVRMAVAATGAFSASVIFNGRTYAVRGTLNADGQATVSVPRPGATPLSVQLSLDLASNNGLNGSITDGTTTSSLSGTKAYDSVANGAYAKAGRYSVVLPANGEDNSLPQGAGYATLVVTATGATGLSGATADGRPFTSGGIVTKDNQLAIFVALPGVNSSISGSLTLIPSEVSDLQGSVHWKRGALATALAHPEALETDLPVIGSRYLAPKAGQAVLDVANVKENSQLVLEAGNMDGSVVQPATLNGANQVVLSSKVLPGMNAVINPATGMFGGSFVNPVTKQVSPIRGIIFQKQDAGYGFYIGGQMSGYSSFSAAQ